MKAPLLNLLHADKVRIPEGIMKLVMKPQDTNLDSELHEHQRGNYLSTTNCYVVLSSIQCMLTLILR